SPSRTPVAGCRCSRANNNNEQVGGDTRRRQWQEIWRRGCNRRRSRAKADDREILTVASKFESVLASRRPVTNGGLISDAMARAKCPAHKDPFDDTTFRRNQLSRASMTPPFQPHRDSPFHTEDLVRPNPPSQRSRNSASKASAE